MKISTIVIKVSIEDEHTDTLASATCLIDASNVHNIKLSKVTDACQRAVARCVDELEDKFPTQKSR